MFKRAFPLCAQEMLRALLKKLEKSSSLPLALLVKSFEESKRPSLLDF
jgi:hypothetical protein